MSTSLTTFALSLIIAVVSASWLTRARLSRIQRRCGIVLLAVFMVSASILVDIQVGFGLVRQHVHHNEAAYDLIVACNGQLELGQCELVHTELVALEYRLSSSTLRKGPDTIPEIRDCAARIESLQGAP